MNKPLLPIGMGRLPLCLTVLSYSSVMLSYLETNKKCSFVLSSNNMKGFLNVKYVFYDGSLTFGGYNVKIPTGT